MDQPQNKLSAFIDGELSDAELSLLQQQLAQSAELKREADALRSVSVNIRAAARPRLLPLQLERLHAAVAAIRERAMLQTSIAAAAIAAAVLLVSMVGLDQYKNGTGQPSTTGEDWSVVLTGDVDAVTGDPAVNPDTPEPDLNEILLRDLVSDLESNP